MIGQLIGGADGGIQNAKTALLPAVKAAGLVSGVNDPKWTNMGTKQVKPHWLHIIPNPLSLTYYH